jgi:predicted ester cyclase
VEHEEFSGLAGGREGLRQFFEMIRTAFPDFSMTIEDMVAEGDKIFIRATMKGTQKADFMGISAERQADGCAVCRHCSS